MLIETHLYAHVCLYTHPPTHGYLKTVSNFNSYLAHIEKNLIILKTEPLA